MPRGRALDARAQRLQIRAQRAEAARERIEAVGVEAEHGEAFGDQLIVLGLVGRLASEGEHEFDVVGGREPARGDHGGFGLVAQRHLQEVRHVERALHLRGERGIGLEAAQTRLILGVERRHEFFGGHRRPSRNSSGSSCVSVSLVTTRPQRACQGCVCRASACVV